MSVTLKILFILSLKIGQRVANAWIKWVYLSLVIHLTFLRLSSLGSVGPAVERSGFHFDLVGLVSSAISSAHLKLNYNN